MKSSTLHFLTTTTPPSELVGEAERELPVLLLSLLVEKEEETLLSLLLLEHDPPALLPSVQLVAELSLVVESESDVVASSEVPELLLLLLFPLWSQSWSRSPPVLEDDDVSVSVSPTTGKESSPPSPMPLADPPQTLLPKRGALGDIDEPVS